MKGSVLLCKQTLHPPRRRVPLSSNPLARWSRNLQPWAQVRIALPRLSVGLEGCRSAFNATNAIRTCMFFGTRTPPTFLSLDHWRSIEHVQSRGDENISGVAHAAETTGTIDVRTWKHIAVFGDDAFHHPSECSSSSSPIVALENFTHRSENVLRRRFPCAARLVVGHENAGVSRKYISGETDTSSGSTTPGRSSASHHGSDTSNNNNVRAECVVYIPQYGTISSLNVVTSLGIALFYAFLDQSYPQSRTLPFEHVDGAADRAVLCDTLEAAKEASLSNYQSRFEQPIPTDGNLVVSPKAFAHPNGNPTPRIDTRPIHPTYYTQDLADIVRNHVAYRQSLLDYSNASRPDGSPRRTRFGISVLYENDYDQRNLGGLIRNANAFLVDQVCYIGRRKFNVMGAVGSYHYTPPVYMGEPFIHSGSSTDDDELRTSLGDALAEADVQRRPSQSTLLLTTWSLSFRQKIEEVCGGPSRFWLLDCGHGSMYAEDYTHIRQKFLALPLEGSDGVDQGTEECRSKSTIDSLLWYNAHIRDDKYLISLCDSEETLYEAAGDGIVLVVPQEGKLPDISILKLCERILTIFPIFVKDSLQAAPGLPSQVASGIALQRLSVVLHPALKRI